MSSDPPTVTQGRHCGACTACCIYIPIAEGVLGPEPKPAGVPCRHVGPLGCRRHQRRPAWCAKFRCWWLGEPAWPAAWRPDKSGLLCVPEDLQRRSGRVRVYEIRPGALEGPMANALLAALELCAAVELVAFAPCRDWESESDPHLPCLPRRMAG